MAQTRGSFSQLFDNIDRRIYVQTDQYLKKLPNIWKQVTDVKSSDRMTEISMPVVGFGDVPERPEGAPIATDLLVPGYQKTVTHTGWALGHEVTIEAAEDDRHDQINKSQSWLTFTAGYTLEKRAANLYNNGFTTETTSDGLSAFNTAHTLVRGGTFSNRSSTDADLSWSALRTAITTLATDTKHHSGQLAMATEDLILYVPPALEMLADRIVNSTQLPGTAENDRNSIKARRNIKIVVNPLLTDVTAWFLVASSKKSHGCKAYERVPIEQLEPSTDDRTKSRLYSLRFRYSFFWEEAQNVYGSAGS